jgi:hypothetical protein
MIVAIDYDETITENVGAWKEIIKTMNFMNFTVLCVTYRQPDCDPHELDWLKGYVEEIIFTGQTAKRKFCIEQGWEVDVWIDDEPMSITHNYHSFKWELPG